MKIEHFALQHDDGGNEILTFAEGPTKTRQGGLRVKPVLVTPKQFTTRNDEGFPVMVSKGNEEKRSVFLTVIDKPV